MVRAIVARNDLNCILMDNRSFVSTLFGTTYDKMQTGLKIMPMTIHLYGFTEDNIVPKGRTTLAVEMGTPHL